MSSIVDPAAWFIIVIETNLFLVILKYEYAYFQQQNGNIFFVTSWFGATLVFVFMFVK